MITLICIFIKKKFRQKFLSSRNLQVCQGSVYLMLENPSTGSIVLMSQFIELCYFYFSEFFHLFFFFTASLLLDV